MTVVHGQGAMEAPATKLLRLKEVKVMTGLSQATIYRWMNDDRFPQSIKLAASAVRWPAAEIEGWIRDRAGEGRP